MANYEATRYDWDGQYLTGIEAELQGITIPVLTPWIPVIKDPVKFFDVWA